MKKMLCALGGPIYQSRFQCYGEQQIYDAMECQMVNTKDFVFFYISVEPQFSSRIYSLVWFRKAISLVKGSEDEVKGI